MTIAWINRINGKRSNKNPFGVVYLPLARAALCYERKIISSQNLLCIAFLNHFLVVANDSWIVCFDPFITTAPKKVLKYSLNFFYLPFCN